MTTMTTITPDTADHELLRLTHAGRADAFTALYRRHQGPLYRYALMRCGSADMAADVVQEAFMGLLTKRFGFDPLRGQLQHFLFGVARGILLVAIAFIVYDRVMTTQDVPMVENSRSAQVFERMRGQMDDQIPADAPGWIVTRYEQMVMGCTATSTRVTTEAPAAN